MFIDEIKCHILELTLYIIHLKTKRVLYIVYNNPKWIF